MDSVTIVTRKDVATSKKSSQKADIVPLYAGSIEEDLKFLREQFKGFELSGLVTAISSDNPKCRIDRRRSIMPPTPPTSPQPKDLLKQMKFQKWQKIMDSNGGKSHSDHKAQVEAVTCNGATNEHDDNKDLARHGCKEELASNPINRKRKMDIIASDEIREADLANLRDINEKVGQNSDQKLCSVCVEESSNHVDKESALQQQKASIEVMVVNLDGDKENVCDGRMESVETNREMGLEHDVSRNERKRKSETCNGLLDVEICRKEPKLDPPSSLNGLHPQLVSTS